MAHFTEKKVIHLWVKVLFLLGGNGHIFVYIGLVKEPAVPPPKTDDTDYDNELSCTHYCAMTDLTLVIIKGEGVNFQKIFQTY